MSQDQLHKRQRTSLRSSKTKGGASPPAAAVLDAGKLAAAERVATTEPTEKRRVRNEIWEQEDGLRNSRNPYAYLHRRAPPSDSKKLARNLRGTASSDNNGSKSDFYRSKEKRKSKNLNG